MRKRADEVPRDLDNLKELIENMYETMYQSGGVGLAAPQVGLSLRLFVVDTAGFVDEDEEDPEDLGNFKRCFINARKVDEEGDPWDFNEGCLSIPDVREDVTRQEKITLEYMDQDFVEHKESFTGLKARVIQHEYDHIEGILFTDHLSPLRKRLLKGKLTNISKGKVKVNYRMKFPRAK